MITSKITDEILKAQIPLRHSARENTDKIIEGETLDTLQAFIEECNKESGLNFQLITNEPLAFSGTLAKYGNFKNVKNYIACVGTKGKDLQEKIGYWGERIVLACQAT